MRKIICLVAALLLVFSLSMGVCASSATQIQTVATIAPDGVCQVTMTVSVQLDQSDPDLYFPIPENAYNVSLNGNRVGTAKADGQQRIDLSGILGGMTGNFGFTVNYSCTGVIVTTEEGIMQLQLPILSGFTYGVDTLNFSVTLPGMFTTLPAFSSGYHMANIEKDLSYRVDGATISGYTLKALKDRETLAMTLVVPPEMFTNLYTEVKSSEVDDIAMGVCIFLALVYWLIFLRAFPQRRQFCSAPAEGIGAGELGSILHLQGVDLTLTVLSWASLGYVYLEQDRRGRVLIHRRMDMGNERSPFEQRIFRDLFRRRTLVDTGSIAYAKLCREVANHAPSLQYILRKESGSLKIFRCINALVGIFGGMSMGIALSGGAMLQWLWILIFAALGAIFAWHIQQWGSCLYLWNRQKLWTACILSGLWLLLSIFATEPGVGFFVIAWQWIAGLLAAAGGRRTELGKHLKAQTMGLRRYLRSVSHPELQRICENNPEYYYTLAPYAIAFDVDQTFARRFGKDRLPECPYLNASRDGGMTAFQWNSELRRVARVMDQRNRQLKLEKLFRRKL